MLEARLDALFKKPVEYTVLDKMQGRALEGKKYQPLFPYFANMKSDKPGTGAFRVLW